MRKLTRLDIIIVMIFLGSTAVGSEVKTSGEAGRFQLVLSTLNREDRFMIDTKTGNIWQAQCQTPDPGCYEAWRKVDVEGINKSALDIIKRRDLLENLSSEKAQ